MTTTRRLLAWGLLVLVLLAVAFLIAAELVPVDREVRPRTVDSRGMV